MASQRTSIDFARHSPSRPRHLSFSGAAFLRVVVASATLLAALATGDGRAPAAAPDRAALDERLAAGEFAKALEAIHQIGDRAERDAQLRAVAEAQALAGARAGSLRSASSIRNPSMRNESLARVSPVSGMLGGGAQADFDSLIDLITQTIVPPSWDEAGGQGSVAPFQAGVYVDAEGGLRRAMRRGSTTELDELRSSAIEVAQSRDPRRASSLRKVSLTRLERQIDRLHAAGRAPTSSMAKLGGLSRIEYVFVYPESGELVVAGPAGEWRADDEGRPICQTNGRPVLQLDDLIVIFRALLGRQDGRFACSIDPRPEALASTKEFLAESAKRPLKPGQRSQWLQQVRDHVGLQDIKIEGIDPRTRAARVIVEADYRMKLVGMGLEPGVLGVKSYLDLVHMAKGEAPPPLEVLRWWFTLNYDAIETTEKRDAFALRGQGVKVMSENEFLDELGQRQHTNDAQPLNRQFAESFTERFGALAEKYPIYADMQNLFDLALVAAIIKREALADRVDASLATLLDANRYQPALGIAPKVVQTVINHRVINEKHVLAGVSGGVRVDPWQFVGPDRLRNDDYGKLKSEAAQGAAPLDLPDDAWWWD